MKFNEFPKQLILIEINTIHVITILKINIFLQWQK